MEKKMEHELDILGPCKGVCRGHIESRGSSIVDRSLPSARRFRVIFHLIFHLTSA